MKKLLPALFIIASAWYAHAEMYDPFAKTARAKLPSSSNLLPPPPLGSVTVVPQPLSVSAIMNNRAFIDGNWYKTGDRIGNREITYIQNGFVGFKEGSRLTMISVGGTRHVLKTKEHP